jgi:stage IV sporulation protein FB
MGDPGSRPRRRVTHRLSVSIGHVLGIDIRVHATFLVLVVLFALAYSGSDTPGVVAGLTWLVVIFACVVVHELAHSLVARRRGGVVHEIVLLPIGGVSKLERLPESPADEFAVAIAGPIASLALATAAFAGSLTLGQALLPIDMFAGPVLPRIAWFNLLVGAFNLLPAFPLDGGRVFRALLERRTDLETATRRSARVGRVLAIVLIAVGILLNVWLALIGLFVYFGASAEEAATIVHLRLRGRQVADAMLLDPVVIDEHDTVGDLRIRILRRTAQSEFPVSVDSGSPGIVGAATLAAAPPSARVGDLMTRGLTVAADASLESDALPLLERSPPRRDRRPPWGRRRRAAAHGGPRPGNDPVRLRPMKEARVHSDRDEAPIRQERATVDHRTIVELFREQVARAGRARHCAVTSPTRPNPARPGDRARLHLDFSPSAKTPREGGGPRAGSRAGSLLTSRSRHETKPIKRGHDDYHDDNFDNYDNYDDGAAAADDSRTTASVRASGARWRDREMQRRHPFVLATPTRHLLFSWWCTGVPCTDTAMIDRHLKPPYTTP